MARANGDDVNDSIELKRIALTPQWWVSQQRWLQWKDWKQLRPHESVITTQALDAEHLVDPKITENIELVGVGT